MDSLFRDEARQGKIESWMGGIQMRPPRIGIISSLIATAGLLLLLGIGVFGRYTHKERAVGRVVPSLGLLTVPSPASGSISTIFVEEGAYVEAGEVLMLVSSSLYTFDDGASSVGQVVDAQIDLQREQLESGIESMSEEQAIRLRELGRQVDSLRKQVALSESHLRMRKLQAERARITFERIKPLEDSQLVTAMQFQQYEAEALEKEGAVESASQSLLALKNELGDIQSKIVSLPIEGQNRRREIGRDLAELAKSKARNRALQAVALTAPKSGRVVGLAVDSGQAVQEGQRVLSVIPDNSEMQAELWVSSRGIGSARSGGAVAIRLEGYPYQTYGVQRGRIERIGESPLDPAEVQARSGIVVRESSYLVMVSFSRNHAPRQEKKITLRSGMRLEADLLLERRRILDVFSSLNAIHSAGEEG